MTVTKKSTSREKTNMRHAELQWRDEIIARRNNPTVSVAIRKTWAKPAKISLVRRLLTMAGL